MGAAATTTKRAAIEAMSKSGHSQLTGAWEDRNLGCVDGHWRDRKHRRVHAWLPPAPKKVKVADCAPRFAEQTTEAEWFVQDDLPTVYYISEHSLDELPQWERQNRPKTPPCSPKLIVPPAEIPSSKLYFATKHGFKGAPILDIRSEDVVQTATWVPPEEISMQKLSDKMARFVLPGRANELS
eukprot:symbB.v1.2.016875.t1/scaffold1300.1/size126151/12